MFNAKVTKKICFVCCHYFGRMSLPDVVEISKALSQRYFKVDVIVLGEGRTKKMNTNLQVIEIDARCWWNKLNRFAFLKKAIGILRKNEYDIIHVYYSPLIVVLPLFLYYKKAKWVLDIRSVAIQGGINALFRNLLCGLESLFFDCVAIITLKILNNFYFIRNDERRIVELPIGVNPELFPSTSIKNRDIRKKNSRFANNRVLIYTGKMDKTRNLYQVIEAFAILQKNGLSNVVLLMIGDGDERSALEMLAETRGIREKVIFKGMIPYNLVYQYLSLSDIALSYIPINETYNYQPPLKTLEYLANNIPQVATATAANRAYIKDKFNGLLSNDTAGDFASKIALLLRDEALKEKISSNCSRSLESHYWNNIVEKRLIPFYTAVFLDAI
jgi:glycosyltransferase involved in cell wall biosynthesis